MINWSLFHWLKIKSLGLLLRLRDEIIGLFDLNDKVVIGEHILLDLLDWELDEHTGDLWHSFVSDEVLDEWEDGFTDSLLQVRVFLWDLGADIHRNLLVLSSTVRIWKTNLIGFSLFIKFRNWFAFHINDGFIIWAMISLWACLL